MHRTYRPPMLISTYGDGPIMGLNEGLIAIGEPVRVVFLTISAMKTQIWIAVTIQQNHGRRFTGRESRRGAGGGSAGSAGGRLEVECSGEGIDGLRVLRGILSAYGSPYSFDCVVTEAVESRWWSWLL